jgi:membrane-associated protease RseP (regulator of RpoE activity)
VSSLFVAGWAGLTVNALNLLPTGELDGGRMALGLFGRRWVPFMWVHGRQKHTLTCCDAGW